MKRIIYLTIGVALLLLSCESKPEAHFFTDTVEPSVGQEVFFTNDSHNARRFEWDFGDGYISNAENPTHIFTGTGSYEVNLTAISKNGLEDKASLIIDVMIPTLLEIEVVEWFEEYTVADASVYLYNSITDWDNAENEESQGFTDANGIVVFSDLGPYVYYVDVWEQEHDNYSLRDEDIGFVRTPEIIPHRINRFIAWVDYVQHKKGDTKGERKMVIRKLERKVTDKEQPGIDYSTENWQELYNRRVVQK